MSSDVEMLSASELIAPRAQLGRLLSRPAASPARQPSPITVEDDDDDDEDDEDDNSAPTTPLPPPHSPSTGPSTSGVDDGAQASKETKKRAKAPASSKPASAISGAKPRSTKPTPRSPSPSPPPPPTRPPPQTVRLDITLGGPDNYEVDIAQLSRESGQRPPTPAPVKRDSSDDSHSEGDDEGDGKHEKKKRRKKKSIAQEYYDVSDPFIDDSELAVDERMYFAQTKQQGFYVSSGQVALLTDKPPPKKPKSKKITVLPPAQSITAALSNASLPPLSFSNSANPNISNISHNGISFTSENGVSAYSNGDEGTSALKRKSEENESASVAAQGNKKKRKVEIKPFPPELEEIIEVLKKEIAKEDWEVKGKFPQGLKPLLAQVALKAIVLGEYNDNFFNLMPKIFPYNRFTMTKLIKRTVWRDHTELLQTRTAQILKDLARLAEEGFAKAKEEYEKSVAAWERRKKAEADGPAALSGEGTPAPAHPDETGNETSAEHDDGVAGGDKKEAAGGGSGGGGRDSHPPTKRYRLTEAMKGLIWQLVCLSNECCRIENEKNQLENNNVVVSDQGVRKVLYQKIVACFPEAWMTSGQVSREVSVMKKKYEKDLENE